MLRNLGFLAGWAVATAAVVGLGWAAVGAVTGAVTAPPPLAGPPAAAPAADEPAPAGRADDPVPAEGTDDPAPAGASAPPGPTAPPDAAAPAQGTGEARSFDMTGGTVAVTERAGAVELLFATPRAGFSVDVRSRGPARVDVRFASDEHESRFRYEAQSGPDLEERPD